MDTTRLDQIASNATSIDELTMGIRAAVEELKLMPAPDPETPATTTDVNEAAAATTTAIVDKLEEVKDAVVAAIEAAKTPASEEPTE